MEQKPLEHEEQSDLQAARAGFGAWWERWGTYVLVVILVIVGGFAAKRWYTHFKTEAHERRWGDLGRETSPKGLQSLADENRGDPVAAYAYLRAGDLLLNQATFPKANDFLPTTTAPASAPASDPAKALSDAEAMYKQALAASPCPKLVAMNSKLGLGTIAEARGNYDAAATEFKVIVAAAASDAELEPIGKQAQARLDYLSRLRVPIVVAPPLPPTSDKDPFKLIDLPKPGSSTPQGPVMPFPSAPSEKPSDKPANKGSETPGTIPGATRAP